MSTHTKHFSSIGKLPSYLRFPQVALNVSLEKAKILFNSHTTNEMLASTMYASLGLNPRSGFGGSLLASLKYYGLLEPTDKQHHYKISAPILDYCFGAPLTQDTVRACLYSVPVNKQLLATYNIDNLPDTSTLSEFLVKKCKYTPALASSYMATFEKNQAFYKNLNTAETPPVLPIPLSGQPQSSHVPPLWRSTARPYVHPLTKGRCIAIQMPDLNDLELQDLNDAKDLLNLALSRIERRAQQLQMATA